MYSSPSARQPYRAAATPPITPTKRSRPSEATPPTRFLSTSRGLASSNEYPESPTGPPRRRSWHHLYGQPSGSLPFPLTRNKTRCGLPRAIKTPRRVAGSLMLLALLILLSRMIVDKDSIGGGLRVGRLRFPRWLDVQSVEEEECSFLSPMSAYRRDLRRLRLMYPSPNSTTSRATADPKGSGNHHHHHLFSSTGHLLLSDSPDAPHPIPSLLALGEKRWEELLSRQSRSLGEAVQEYTRRYGRRPPKGFDIWWEFAIKNELVLPDEYDRINLDLAPFFALPRAEMKRRMRMVEDMPETFTLVVQDGQVSIEIKDKGGLDWDGTKPRAKGTAGLLSAFSAFLPDLRATFSIFDQPQIYLSWARRGSLVDLGLRGEVTTHLQETDEATVRLSRSCAPDSNYRKNSSFYEGHSYIYDSLEAGDICQNPYLVPLHGLTIEPHHKDSHPRPHTQLLPLFSLAKTSINSDILITPLDQFEDGPGRDPVWHRKRSDKLAWRGSPTGISMMTRDLPWWNAHRMRLHSFANNASEADFSYLSPDYTSLHESPVRLAPLIGSPQAPLATLDGELRYRRNTLSTAEATDFFFDISLAGQPLQCSEEDGTCDELRSTGRPISPRKSSISTKFLLDIDGNGWSGRFRRLMSTNSVVIKTGIFTEWFQPHLIPWFMYIPAKLDFTDLADILAFFRGTPNYPDAGFDETARALARNGQCFVKKMFRMEDLQAYMMRLFLEYARLAADEGDDMDYYYESDAEEDDIRDEAERNDYHGNGNYEDMAEGSSPSPSEVAAIDGGPRAGADEVGDDEAEETLDTSIWEGYEEGTSRHREAIEDLPDDGHQAQDEMEGFILHEGQQFT